MFEKNVVLVQFVIYVVCVSPVRVVVVETVVFVLLVVEVCRSPTHKVGSGACPHATHSCSLLESPRVYSAAVDARAVREGGARVHETEATRRHRRSSSSHGARWAFVLTRVTV